MSDPLHRVHHAKIVNEFPIDSSKKLSFAQIIDKDSPGKSFGFTKDILAMRCIDIDAVEIANAGQLDKTMDCCIGVASLNPHNREYSAPKLMLVELKLNCINHTLKPQEYKGKIHHTCDLLSKYGYLIHPQKVFLFCNRFAYSKAKHDVDRWSKGGNAGELKAVVVLTPGLFNGFIGFEHQIKQIPITNPDHIISSINKVSGSAEDILEAMAKWKNIADKYRAQHNESEALHIEKTLRKAVLDIIPTVNDEIERKLLEMYLPIE